MGKGGKKRSDLRAHTFTCTFITFSECMFVALGIQHAQRMCHIVICGLPGCTVFFRIIS